MKNRQVSTSIYFAFFWVGALAAMVLFIFGDEGLAGVAAGAALVALAFALLTDWRRRNPR